MSIVITKTQLAAAIPQATPANIMRFTQPLNDAMAKYQINQNAKRVASFLAQFAIETAYLNKMVESTNYTKAKTIFDTFPGKFRDLAHAQEYVSKPQELANFVYANKYGNGNVASGDGFRYRGRGMGITFKDNYIECGKALKLDLVNHPELLEDPVNAALAGAWFFNVHNCCSLADVGEFGKITQKITGSFEGAQERLSIYGSAQRALA